MLTNIFCYFLGFFTCLGALLLASLAAMLKSDSDTYETNLPISEPVAKQLHE